MDVASLKDSANRRVQLELDAWKDMSGAEREAQVWTYMLRILEEEEDDILRNKLMVARGAWENKAWAVNHDSFAGFLCDVGGKYQNEDGTPSGSAYDLSSYVTIAWDALVKLDMNPLDIGSQHWSKTRILVSATRQNIKMLDEAGNEVKRIEQAKEIVVSDEDKIKKAARDTISNEVSVRNMRDAHTERRIDQFGVEASLNSNGTWSVQMTLSDQQMRLFQSSMSRHISEVRIV